MRLAAVLIALCFSSALAENGVWSMGSAMTLPEKRIEVGLFHPLQYGLAPDVELSTYPLDNILFPNISLKKAWTTRRGLLFATQHEITCPTPLLRTLARPGAGGIVPENSEIPFMLAFSQQGLMTKKWNDRFAATFKAGFRLVARFGELDMPTIDYPIVYPRTAAYHSGFGVNAGADAAGALRGRLGYHADVDFFLTGLDEGGWALEHKALLVWKKSRRFSLCLGYQLSVGAYPFGNELFIMPFYPIPAPLFDLQWGFF